eukprot:2206270-Amphidinium_carterae.2
MSVAISRNASEKLDGFNIGFRLSLISLCDKNHVVLVQLMTPNRTTSSDICIESSKGVVLEEFIFLSILCGRWSCWSHPAITPSILVVRAHVCRAFQQGCHFNICDPTQGGFVHFTIWNRSLTVRSTSEAALWRAHWG